MKNGLTNWRNATIAVPLALAGCLGADEAPIAEHEEGVALDGIAAELTVASDVKVGIQLADDGTRLTGDWAFSSSLESGGTVSPWACDNNCFDPDAARVEVDALFGDNVRGRDFRVCMQASDGRTGHTQRGSMRCTRWASEGSSTTGLVTDGNGYDPDSYRVQIQTRNWPGVGDQEVDFRLRIRGWDGGSHGRWSTWTGWASAGGGRSGWGSDGNFFDPDGFEIEMDTTRRSVWSFCSPSQPCQHGFGDCDRNSDCVSGAVCRHDVGDDYGYDSSAIDVCVSQ